MPTTHPYVSVTDLRTYLQDTASNLNATLLDNAVKAASMEVDGLCGPHRTFTTATAATTRTFHPDRPDLCWTDDFFELTAVATDEDADGTWETAWTIATDVLKAPDTFENEAAFAWGWLEAPGPTRGFPTNTIRPTVQVTAKWGWSALPEAVRQATLLIAARLYQLKDTPHGVAGTSEFGAIRISREDPDVKRLLRRYYKIRARSQTYAPPAGALFPRRL